VIYAAKRARQITATTRQLGEGLLEYVGPLVDTHVHEKPLSIALREINAGLLTRSRSSRPDPTRPEGRNSVVPTAQGLARPGRADPAARDRGSCFGVRRRDRRVQGLRVLRRLNRVGATTWRVVPTASDDCALSGAPTWEALSGHPVSTEVWIRARVPHVRSGDRRPGARRPRRPPTVARAAHGSPTTC